MPYAPIPVPGVIFDTNDRGNGYMPKLSLLAQAVDTAVNGFNSQLAAANDAEIFAAQCQAALAAAITKANEAAASSNSANTHRATAQTAAGTATTKANEAAADRALAQTAAGTATTKAGEAANDRALAQTAAATATTKAGDATAEANRAKAEADKAEYWANLTAANVTGAMTYAGDFSAAAGTFPAGAQPGQLLRISVAGTLGPFTDGVTRTVDVGDFIVKRTTGTWDWWDAQDSRFKDWVKQTSAIDTTPGAILTVGAFGWGGPGMAAPADNCDNATTSGVYNLASTTSGAYAGKVTGDVMVVFRYSASAIQHLAITRTGEIVTRGLNGTWSAWARQWNTNTLVKQTSTADVTPGSVLLVGAYGWGGAPLGAPGVTELKTLPYTAWFISENANITDLPPGWAQGRHYVQNVGKPTDAYAMQIIYAVSTTAPDEICRTAIRRMRNAGVWSDCKIYKFLNDPVDRTTVISAAATINKADTVTRAAIYAINSNPGSFSVALGTGYSAGDSIELSVGIGGNYVITLTAPVSMFVAGGTAGTSHTITGPVNLHIRAVHTGTTWILFVS